ncbi:MAG: hypothetical protein COA78_36925 [Blastopirellula sp.]|nr:MAG: hypothetical protein COA78_36925 [Blastopirellula sp.]
MHLLSCTLTFRLLLFGLTLVVCTSATFAQSAKKPLKVFILAGQSNMEGHAKLSSFDHISMDPKTVPILKEMRAADGTPRVCEQVWISYLTGAKGSNGEGHGQLTAGYGSRMDPKVIGEKIGPEFTFGIYMQKYLDEPILIIKTAWGGKSLHTDFRSPSAGPYVFNEKELQGLKKQDKDIRAIQAKRAEATGHYYRLMIDHVQHVLKDIKRVCPIYDQEQGYEIAGFVWFQGWNDMVDSSVYPNRYQPGGYDQYSVVLEHFIRDVRMDLDAPDMHFVIGVMGAGGPVDQYDESQKRYAGVHTGFRNAMAASATKPAFKKNVTAVWTEKYWDKELDVVAKKNGLVSKKAKTLRDDNKGYPDKAGTISPQEQKAIVEKYRKEVLTPRDLELLKGITNADYHYKGSAKVIAQIGKGFAEALAPFLNQ